MATKVRITYFKNNFLDVKVQHEKWDEWERCFTLWNVTLPGSAFIGLTAHTGDISDDHDIISVSTSNAVYHEETASDRARRKQNERKARLSMGFGFFSPSFPLFLVLMSSDLVFRIIKWIALLVLIGVGVMAARSFTAKRNAKRF